MAVNKKELLTAFKNDKKEAERHQSEWTMKRSEYLAETYGNPYGNEAKGKSAIVSKDIKRQLEWMLPSITSPFLSTSDVVKGTPVTFEDGPIATQSELVLNTQFCRQFDRYNFIMKSTRVLATEGTVVVQTGWDYEDEEVEVEREVVVVDGETGMESITTEMVTETKIIRNQPTAIVCRNEDIFIDPTCMDDMDKCQFIVHRHHSSLSALKADGRYKNLDKLKEEDHSLNEDPDYAREDITYFEFKDKARKQLLVHEYWGRYDIKGNGDTEAIVCAWVNNTIIRLEANPYPDQKPPFVVAPFNPIPFQMFGEALAENIGDNQKVKTAITRGIIDNMAQSTNGQVAVRKGALDQVNRKKMLNGASFEFNGTPNDFWQGSYNQIPGSAFNMLEMMNNEIEAQTGVKSFSGGINGGALGDTATGARGALDATSTRRMNIVRNYSENVMKPVIRKWAAYNSAFLDAEQVTRITNTEYIEIKADDVASKIDIDFSISTAEDNAAKVEQLSFLLQTTGQAEDPQIRRELRADIYDLMSMPEEAKRMREYTPEPDPMQQEMQQIALMKAKLENSKLQAEISAIQAGGQENLGDTAEKYSKAKLIDAQTAKLSADTNMVKEKTDQVTLDYLKSDRGMSHLEKMEMEDKKHGAKLELEQQKINANIMQMQYQAQLGDKQIGVLR